MCRRSLPRRPCFNPRARVGRDLGRSGQYPAGGVSIRAPAWGATNLTPPTYQLGTGFNPRARVGRDTKYRRWAYTFETVSIRAPAWGATMPRAFTAAYATVSIRAPAWGATRTGRRFAKRQLRFNPRARVGRDGGLTLTVTTTVVSIRAPAWGATRLYAADLRRPGVSIRAPAWGATRQAHAQAACCNVSIRAPAWGATRNGCGLGCCRCCFNPRARVGRDSTPSKVSASTERFQSARPRGARPVIITGSV